MSPSNPNPIGSTDDVGVDDDPRRRKMFFTTSDLIGRMNSAMRCANNPDDGPTSSSSSSSPFASLSSGATGAGGGFELHARMPDGSYRRAHESEMAAADFQSKMKQASEMISGMDRRRKLEWAARHRREGNALFARGEYGEAMDVYLTCLVAVDRGGASSASSADDDDDDILRSRMEEEIQLPVLLNLALSAMKMGMLSKAEKFCNFAIDETACGKISPKAHFRRGRVRLLMGRYASAESDLDTALGLLPLDNAEEIDGGGASGRGNDADVESERAVVLREKRRLHSLVRQEERNMKVQRRAMERLFGSSSDREERDGEDESPGSLSIYPDKMGPVQLPRNKGIDEAIADDDDECQQPTCFQWYQRMIGRCAQRLLDLIGDEEEDEEEDVLSSYQQDLKNSPLIEGKKDA
jgi:tetratricopeptide (TPR) repeat protein